MVEMIEMWRDPATATIHIKIEISEVFTATHLFACQQFERVFGDHEKPLSTKLLALAEFVRRTQENR